jgi:hypothetical protein
MPETPFIIFGMPVGQRAFIEVAMQLPVASSRSPKLRLRISDEHSPGYADMDMLSVHAGVEC